MNQNNWSGTPGPSTRFPTAGPSSQPQQQQPPFPSSNPPPQQQQHVPPHLETAEQAKLRFETECEFVQSLANPHYLNYLAQRGYFKEAAFVRYLKYLCYFKEPNYARTLKYPQALTFLDLLQKAEFREAIASVNNAKFIEDQLLLQWHYYLRKRQRLSKHGTTVKDSSPEDEEDDNIDDYEDELAQAYSVNDINGGPTSSEPPQSRLSNATKNSSDSTDEPMDEDEYPTPTPDERSPVEGDEKDDEDEDDDDDDDDEDEEEREKPEVDNDDDDDEDDDEESTRDE